MSLILEGQSIAPGNIVEFMHGNQPQIGFVIEAQASKLKIYTINKRETKIAVNRILPWVGPKYSTSLSRQEMLDKMCEHQDFRGSRQATLDTMEIWNLAQGELEKAPLTWFASLIWEAADDDQIAALGRAMLQAKSHFKFQPPEFVIYNEEEVELKLKKEEEEKEYEEILKTGQILFKKVWTAHETGKTLSLAEFDEFSKETLDNLKDFLLKKIAGSEDSKTTKLWNTLKKGMPDTQHLPLILAQGCGFIKKHYNFLFDQANYCSTNSWTEKFKDEIERIRTAVESESSDPSPLKMRSIDAATTRDIDDAFNLVKHDDGSYTLTIALARPCFKWDFNHELNEAVQARGTSIYLPEGTSHMLPEELGIGALSLFEGCNRPALLTEINLDKTGIVTSVIPKVGWANITQNTTYEAVEKLLSSGEDQELIHAYELSELLLGYRIANGAIVIRKPEPEIEIENWPDQPKVHIKEKAKTTKADQIISEFMILVNSALGKYAAENDIPVLYRVQDIALPSDLAGIITEPHEIFTRVRHMIPPIMTTKSGTHATLAVSGYSPISSPLRRYADFLNMAQLCSFLEQGTPLFDYETLEEKSSSLAMKMQYVSKIQRFRPRYWKLLFLAQNKKAWQSSVIVDCNGHLATLAMPHIQINVRTPKDMLGDKLYPGQMFQIRFGKIDPLTNELRVVEGMEE